MAVTDAELFVQAMDLTDSRQALVEETLRQLPGVQFVSPRLQTGPSVEACIQVAFDPEVTNPLIMKDALSRLGFNVLSVRQSDPANDAPGATATPAETRSTP